MERSSWLKRWMRNIFRSAVTPRPRRPVRRNRLQIEPLEERIVMSAVAWDGGGDGLSWQDRFNWNTDQVPGTLDDVTINVSGTPTVRYSQATSTVHSISNSENLLVADGALTVSTTFQQGTGSLTESGGSLTLSGGTVTGGSVSLQGGTFTGTLTFRNTALTTSAAVSGPSTLILQGGNTLAGEVPVDQTLWVQGANAAFNATLTLAGDVTNHGTIRMESVDQSWNSNLTSGAFTLTNAPDGTLQVNRVAAGARTLAGNF